MNVTIRFSSARCIRFPGFALTRVSCCCVIDVMLLGYVCRTRLIRTQVTVCSATFRLFPSKFESILDTNTYTYTRAAAAAHALEFEVLRCRTSLFASFFLLALPHIVGNDLPRIVFDTGMLDGFRGAVNRWLLPELRFFQYECNLSTLLFFPLGPVLLVLIILIYI